MVTAIPILIVEDDPGWQMAVCRLLETDPRFQPTSIVDRYDDALVAYQQHQPRLALLDWQIQGEKDGLDVGQKLLELGMPNHQIILMSAANPSSIPEHPFLYIPKNQLMDSLLPLLDSVFPH